MKLRLRDQQPAREARTAPAHASALAHGMRITILRGDAAARTALSNLWHQRHSRFTDHAKDPA